MGKQRIMCPPHSEVYQPSLSPVTFSGVTAKKVEEFIYLVGHCWMTFDQHTIDLQRSTKGNSSSSELLALHVQPHNLLYCGTVIHKITTITSDSAHRLHRHFVLLAQDDEMLGKKILFPLLIQTPTSI